MSPLHGRDRMTEGEAMTALTTERLGDTVGAMVDGVDCDSTGDR